MTERAAEKPPNAANWSLPTEQTVAAGKLRASVTSDDHETTDAAAAGAAVAERRDGWHGDDVDDDDGGDGCVNGKTVAEDQLEAAQYI